MCVRIWILHLRTFARSLCIILTDQEYLPPVSHLALDLAMKAKEVCKAMVCLVNSSPMSLSQLALYMFGHTDFLVLFPFTWSTNLTPCALATKAREPLRATNLGRRILNHVGAL